MRKIKLLLRIITCLILTLALCINSAFAQCREFTISEYEKMIDMPFSELSNYVSKKGYKAYNEKFFLIVCKNGEKDEYSNYFGIKNKTVNLYYSSFNKDSFIKRLISNGYTIQKDYTTLVYGNGKYVVEIVSENNQFNIRMSKENPVEVDKSKTSNSDGHTESCYAKRVNQNTLEVKSKNHITDIEVKKGDRINYKVSGRISLGVFAGLTGPSGIDGFTSYNKVDGFRHGALLGQIDEGPWFPIGSNRLFIADRSGILTLIVNDSDPSNNEGSFIFEYSINNSSKSTTNNNLSFADLLDNTSNSTTNNASNIDDNKFLIRNYYNTRIYFELSRDKSTWTSYSLAGSSKSDYWYTDQQQSFFRIKALKEKVYKIEAGKKYKIDWNKSEWCFDLFPDGDR